MRHCETKALCTETGVMSKTVTSYMEDHRAVEIYLAIHQSGKETNRLRSQTNSRGLSMMHRKIRNEDTLTGELKESAMCEGLKYAAMNLKKLAIVEVAENRLPPIFDHNKRPYF